jgi:hypothetical protein
MFAVAIEVLVIFPFSVTIRRLDFHGARVANWLLKDLRGDWPEERKALTAGLSIYN